MYIKDIKEPEEVVEIEKKFITFIYQKGNDKVVERQIDALENGSDNERKEAKKKLLEFKDSTNIYQKVAYEKQKTKIEKLLKGLSHSVPKNPNASQSIPWHYILPLFLVGVLVIIGVMVVRLRRKKKV